MKDYPSLKMFLQEKTDSSIYLGFMSGSSKIIVSSFDSQKTEEENIKNLRELFHCDISIKCGYPSLIYGDNFGVAIFNIRPDLLPKMRKYCQQAASDYNQLGYIEWNSDKKQANFVGINEIKTLLLPWDNTIERLEEWIDKIHHGFKFEGIWNREVSYVQKKWHEWKRNLKIDA